MMVRSLVVRVVVCCGLVAAALPLELHYNLATYIQQVQYSTVQHSTVQHDEPQLRLQHQDHHRLG